MNYAAPLEIRDTTVCQGDGQIKSRHVFFVPGYDPNVARRYRELYRKEGRKQADISGYSIDVSACEPSPGSYGWTVFGQTGGHDVTATIEFITWDGIVKSSMDRSVLSTYWVLIRTFWIYLTSGALWRLFRLRRPPMIAALYPAIALICQLMIASAIAASLVYAAIFVVPTVIAIGLGIGAFAAVLNWFRKIDRHLYAYYLINDYGYTALRKGRWSAALQDRISDFAGRIRNVATDDSHGEVLIVGHSSGAHIAVSALALALRQGLPENGPKIGLLTLGQVIPMVSFLPEAQDLRRDLHDLSKSSEITWVDVSAPGDGGCFALTDPVHVSGVSPSPKEKRWPLVLSAAFSQTMSPKSHASTRWRFFRRHIQYLCAFERPRDYDYFQITAGPKTLADRFADRTSSASRKETVLSAYRDMS